MTLGQRLNIATLALLNALLDCGDVGEVNARAIDARADLLQGRALELGLGLGVGLVAQFNELPLAGLAGLNKGEGVGVDVGIGIAHGFVWFWFGVLDWT